MKIDTIQNSFASGEFAPSLFGRVDIAQYENACENVRNFLIKPSGELVTTPGTEYINNAKFTLIATSSFLYYWPVTGIVNRNSSINSLLDTRDSIEGVRQPAPECTFTAMYVNLLTAPGVGKSRKFTVYKNDLPTSFELTISGTATTGSISRSLSFGPNMQDTMGLVEARIDGATYSGFSLAINVRYPSDKQVYIGYDRFLFKGIVQNISPFGSVGPHANRTVNTYTFWDNISFGNYFHYYAMMFSSSGYINKYSVKINTHPDALSPSETGFYPDILDSAKYIPIAVKTYNDSKSTLSNTEYVRYTGSETGLKASSSVTTSVLQGQFAGLYATVPTQFPNNQEIFELVEFVPSNSGERVFNCHMDVYDFEGPPPDPNYSQGTVMTFSPFGSGENNTNIEEFSIIPCSGTIKNLYVYLIDETTPESNTTVTFRKNSSDTSLITFLPTGSFISSDTSNSFTVSPGDLISIKFQAEDKFASLGSVAYLASWTFVADTSTDSPIFLNNLGQKLTGVPSTSSIVYDYARARLIPFVFSKNDSYVIEINSGAFRFYTNGSVVEA